MGCYWNFIGKFSPNKKGGRDDVQEMYKKDSREAISANPERLVFEIFNLMPTMLHIYYIYIYIYR